VFVERTSRGVPALNGADIHEGFLSLGYALLPYAIKFHTRRPTVSNGRVYFQGGGGINGVAEPVDDIETRSERAWLTSGRGDAARLASRQRLLELPR
jgi:hypothetical protein